jgi:hypothetical protein
MINRHDFRRSASNKGATGMKKLTGAAFGIVLAVLLVSVGLAGQDNGPVQEQQQAEAPAADEDNGPVQEQQQAEAPAADEDNGPVQEQQQAEAQAADKDNGPVQEQQQAEAQAAGEDGEWVVSSVSQRQIDAVLKREDALANRDEKMRIRERNLQPETADTGKLFRRSR